MARLAAPHLRRAAHGGAAEAQGVGAGPSAQSHRHDLGLAAEGRDLARRRAGQGQRGLRGVEARVRRRFSLAIGLISGVAIAVAAGLAVIAQPSDNQSSSSGGAASSSSSSDVPPGVPVIQAPPEVTPPDNSASGRRRRQPGQRQEARGDAAAWRPSPQLRRARRLPVPSRCAVRPPMLQALDKVTAETIRFAVRGGPADSLQEPRVRGEGLREHPAWADPVPPRSAYVVIDFAPLGFGGHRLAAAAAGVQGLDVRQFAGPEPVPALPDLRRRG